MRIITRIAKNELRYLFYSPIAWFLAIVMLVMSAVFYTNNMFEQAKFAALLSQYMPGYEHSKVDSVTASVFFTYFSTVLQQLYLFVPLLTMGIINREFNNGTINLLYSSPVKLRQIVLGKYLALLMYCLILISICGIFILLGFADIKALDFPPLLSGTLGLFLLTSALTAIGFFMSSLTSYQIVSAIATFTVLFVLSRIGGLWQEYDFVRDLSWFLSIAGRTEKMLIGLITTKDILYYLIIIFMFVGFTFLKLQDGLETRRWYVKTTRYLAIILIGLTFGYAGSLPATTGYLDTTAQQLHTIHPKTQQLLRDLKDGPLEITLYTNLFDKGINHGIPAARNAYLSGFWEYYQRFKTNIHFKYEYYYAVKKGDSSLYKAFPGKSLKQIAGLQAKSMQIDSAIFKSPEEMQHITTLESEDYHFLMLLSYQGRTTLLRTHLEESKLWPLPQNVNAALSRLLNKPMPKVFFVTGELERSIYKTGERELFLHTIDKTRQDAMINNGFDQDTLNLSVQNIPDFTSLLVLADPRMVFSETVTTKLRNYISNGGNIMILGEPGKQYVMNPLLRETGIQLANGQLVQYNKEETPEKVGSKLTLDALGLSEERAFRLFKHIWAKGGTDSAFAIHAGVTSLSGSAENGFTLKPLLMTQTNQAWLKAGKLVTDSTPPVFDPLAGDNREVTMPTAVQLTRMINQKEQRIIISGDADIISNYRGHQELTRSFYGWTSNSKFPAYTPDKFANDNITIITPVRAAIQQIIFTWVVPAIVLIIAIVILIRRKRK